MITHVGHGGILRRIGINVGAGYTPGINAVITGAAQAAGLMGWEILGIRDGFEGLLRPDRYPDGGLLTLSPQRIADLNPFEGGILGQSPRVDPFHVPTVNADNKVEEVDVSDEILKRLKEENIDALISVVGGRGLGILHKLHRKGLHTVCIPKSIENDIAATSISFGFNSALSFTIEMLTRAKQAARSARKIAVVEVIGAQAGWLALQAGIAVSADAVLLPEIQCNLNLLAQRLEEKITPRRPYGLVIVAEGVKLRKKPQTEKPTCPREAALSLKASLPPQALGEASEQVIIPSDEAAETVANELRLLLAMEPYPLVVGPWARGGDPTAVDLQLGMAYGAGAIQALKTSRNGVMLSFVPPQIKYVPLAEVSDKVRTVPADCEFVKIAESLGIYFGNFSAKN
jgi:ATP-dependent phosphofructokinase / diphosphate-dependent phosphofructokinase